MEAILVLLEIVKYVIPALLVFGAIYYLSKQFFTNQENLIILKNRREATDSTRLIKLQAFERLTLFSERIDVASLAQRLATRSMSAKELEQAMLISVQQEYEHNLAQQIYVSDQLWQIITLAKSETIRIVRQSASTLGEGSTALDLLSKISETVEGLQLNPSEQAIKALRSEASLLLK